MSGSTMLDAALDLARRGWNVFPSAAGSKLPLIKSWPDVATTDPAQVRAWWTRWPDANVSHCTGASGTMVLDLDGPEGFASWRNLQRVHGRAPVTRMVVSPRPEGGVHLYWRAPADLYVKSTAGRIGSTHTTGIDVRGTRGQAVLPPSVRDDGGAYRWHDPEARIADPPRWLVAMLTPKPPVFARPARIGTVGSRLDGLVRVVTGCGKGDLNNRLHWAACRAGEMVRDGAGSADEAARALLAAAIDKGHPRPGAEATIRSGMGKYGVTPASGEAL
ncbi:bifunctional DNA primase/polymerase [Euzebya rosea]|uniref:bifunctional DNA primase/polymerase n=1 Tax=Euzebya rosea TaxID=2052804 RepID=UPI000D3EC409|nr:bifunctional DNA primase/polymerase [Euzebya rosea]